MAKGKKKQNKKERALVRASFLGSCRRCSAETKKGTLQNFHIAWRNSVRNSKRKNKNERKPLKVRNEKSRSEIESTCNVVRQGVSYLSGVEHREFCRLAKTRSLFTFLRREKEKIEEENKQTNKQAYRTPCLLAERAPRQKRRKIRKVRCRVSRGGEKA